MCLLVPRPALFGRGAACASAIIANPCTKCRAAFFAQHAALSCPPAERYRQQEAPVHRAGLLAPLDSLHPYPESVPINRLVRVPGTPPEDSAPSTHLISCASSPGLASPCPRRACACRQAPATGRRGAGAVFHGRRQFDLLWRQASGDGHPMWPTCNCACAWACAATAPPRAWTDRGPYNVFRGCSPRAVPRRADPWPSAHVGRAGCARRRRSAGRSCGSLRKAP